MNFLKGLRLSVEINQEDLAELATISQPAISNYERGLVIPNDVRQRFINVFKEKFDIQVSIEDFAEEWVEDEGI